MARVKTGTTLKCVAEYAYENNLCILEHKTKNHFMAISHDAVKAIKHGNYKVIFITE